ncbi:peptidase inhibitor 16 [Puntigrus tetrazona]|uniref:peptidase inhibitor 16 n=1 Tax=Puntigrus tetrazona TaxID=1606681 RepID=UPI001C896681|nr:peptidase inhibitor 16 [Puntigrus tetrazona]
MTYEKISGEPEKDTEDVKDSERQTRERPRGFHPTTTACAGSSGTRESMTWSAALRSAGLWVILSLAAGQMTEQEKSTIIDLHNELRSKVQPRAAFMQKVVWDETLRLVAEAYAAKCIWNHNPDLEELGLGENLFVSTGPFNATKATLDWFDEHVDYDFENNTCPDDKMCGHYTQVVWAGTNRVGCATHFCDTLEGLDFEKATLLVCDYFPPGNYEGQKPYESGEPCSKCPENLPLCENSMCVAENLFNLSEKPESDDSETTTAVLPERPRTTTEPITGPEDPTQAHVKIERDVQREMSSGSEPEGLSSSLVTLLFLLAPLVL